MYSPPSSEHALCSGCLLLTQLVQPFLLHFSGMLSEPSPVTGPVALPLKHAQVPEPQEDLQWQVVSART